MPISFARSILTTSSVSADPTYKFSFQVNDSDLAVTIDTDNSLYTSDINEGETLQVTINTTNVDNGTVLYWRMNDSDDSFYGSGVYAASPDDVDSEIKGTVTIQNNVGKFSLNISLDQFTDTVNGDRMRFHVHTDSENGTEVATSKTDHILPGLPADHGDGYGFPYKYQIKIIDTSKTITYSMTYDSDVYDEGETITFNVTTTNAPNGYTIYYRTIDGSGGTQASHDSDFISRKGSFTVTSNAGSFTITPFEDSETEGTERFRVVLSKEEDGDAVLTTSNIYINDTSTPAYVENREPSSGDYYSTTNPRYGIFQNWSTYEWYWNELRLNRLVPVTDDVITNGYANFTNGDANKRYYPGTQRDTAQLASKWGIYRVNDSDA